MPIAIFRQAIFAAFMTFHLNLCAQTITLLKSHNTSFTMINFAELPQQRPKLSGWNIADYEPEMNLIHELLFLASFDLSDLLNLPQQYQATRSIAA